MRHVAPLSYRLACSLKEGAAKTSSVASTREKGPVTCGPSNRGHGIAHALPPATHFIAASHTRCSSSTCCCCRAAPSWSVLICRASHYRIRFPVIAGPATALYPSLPPPACPALCRHVPDPYCLSHAVVPCCRPVTVCCTADVAHPRGRHVYADSAESPTAALAAFAAVPWPTLTYETFVLCGEFLRNAYVNLDLGVELEEVEASVIAPSLHAITSGAVPLPTPATLATAGSAVPIGSKITGKGSAALTSIVAAGVTDGCVVMLHRAAAVVVAGADTTTITPTPVVPPVRFACHNGTMCKGTIPSARVKGLAFHPKRPLLLASLHSGDLLLYDLHQCSTVWTQPGHIGPAVSDTAVHRAGLIDVCVECRVP